MFDVILLVATGIFMLGMFIYVGKSVYSARNNRPVMIELRPVNKEKSASTVDLAPYVKVISGKFAETLGDRGE